MTIIIKREEFEKKITLINSNLANAKVIAIPTDTSYGLAVDASKREALKKLFELKKRPPNKPVAIFLSSPDEIYEYGEVTNELEKVIRILPLELTIITWSKKKLPEGYIVMNGKIGLRVPNHETPRTIVSRYGHPITATSANIIGEPEIYDPKEILRKFPELDTLIDFGKLPLKPVSTVIDFTTSPPTIIREGYIKKEQLKKLTKITYKIKKPE